MVDRIKCEMKLQQIIRMGKEGDYETLKPLLKQITNLIEEYKTCLEYSKCIAIEAKIVKENIAKKIKEETI